MHIFFSQCRVSLSLRHDRLDSEQLPAFNLDWSAVFALPKDVAFLNILVGETAILPLVAQVDATGILEFAPRTRLENKTTRALFVESVQGDVTLLEAGNDLTLGNQFKVALEVFFFFSLFVSLALHLKGSCVVADQRVPSFPIPMDAGTSVVQRSPCGRSCWGL